MRLGDACDGLEGVLRFVHTQPNTVLLKESGLYCFEETREFFEDMFDVDL